MQRVKLKTRKRRTNGRKKNGKNGAVKIDFDNDSPPMQMINESSRLTPELQAWMCHYVEKMMPVRDACFLCGLFEETHYMWMRKGEDYLRAIRDNEIPNGSHRKYAEYAQAIRLAGAKFRMKLVNRSFIPDEFKSTWIRDITILERRDRDHWQRQAEVRVNVEEFDPDETFL